MFDHIGLKVKNPDVSARFYKAVLAPLGYLPDSSGTGFGPANEPALWLYKAADSPNGGTHVALVNMGSTPLRATAVETALAQGASAADAAREAAVGTDAPADLNASPGYREHLAQVLVRRALEAL